MGAKQLVFGEDARRQAKFGRIGACDHFVFTVEIEHRHDGAENLFADDGHIVAAAGENGRRNKSPTHQIAVRYTLAASQEFCPLPFPKRDIAEHLFHMCL